MTAVDTPGTHGGTTPRDLPPGLSYSGATVLVLEGFDPRRLVSANQKLHHHVAGRVRAYWRTLARDAAHAAYGYADEGEAWHTRARVTVTVRFPDRRRHDTPNLYSYVFKPIVDGLIDARVLPDDDDLHMEGPDPRRDPDRGPHRITITITDLGDTP